MGSEMCIRDSGPQVRHRQLRHYARRLVPHLQQRVCQRHLFLAVSLPAVHLHDLGVNNTIDHHLNITHTKHTYRSLVVGRTHNVVLRNQLILVHLTEDVAAADDVTLLEVHGLVQPLALSTPSRQPTTPTCPAQAHQLHGE